MFRKLRIRFIAIASLAILIVLFSVVGVLNSARHIQTVNEINKILTLISDNDGTFPSVSKATSELGNTVSVDTLFQYRYFSAVIDEDGNITSLNSSNISDLTDEQVESYLTKINKSGDTSGDFRYNNHTYSYLVTDESDDSTLIVVLDATNQVEENMTLVHLSLWMSGVSFAFFVLMVSIFSGRVIEPFIRNYERQRRFITNAGHELKTPLAIISANNELVEMMNGESEWTKSTNDQVERMTGLINSLVAMARLEEQPEVVLTDLNFSAIAEDAAEDFKGPVIKDGKQFVMEIQPDIHVKAEEKSLFELVTLLVDNANKYCDAGGTVSVKLSKANRLSKARLEISNTYAEGKNVDYSKFFERFYREDESHNNKKSGYGIGLSMAQTMVKLFKGSISVSYSGDTITFLVSL
ncbi:two-component system sensor histidine kinase [Streptococcus gallolyticus]|uniref:histidine kinase n=1 Tax=Streptococcus gallolyticus TaxID=315405 RepID=A0AA94M2U4_9STRE|nr:HAMP domain-containing sensor histidine kinase [Streptococcus gallolyticus]AQP42319.1 two-component system sensor histidine kinase [Streptococcus gallolyticus subsp. gallolyticus DSM 16831]EFM29462.1 histidine kinase A domain protein [Streptococcus gallolyticus subsp. gallolyticus TX20005]QKI01954.1 HAMP domain-containing histidine kinase [Streptococcus gallolyticus]QWX85953.1 HAMP domain-containing histidine kinase [Streptococcus gallolyticus subsp. gallolyticus TX20005]SQG79618.1 two-comp